MMGSAEDAAVDGALNAVLAQLALQHVEGIARDVVSAQQRVDLSALSHATHCVRAQADEWTKDQEKVALRTVKELTRIAAKAVSAAMMDADNVQRFVYLDENTAPLLEFVLAVAEQIRSTDKPSELLRWTPFAIHASAFFCCGQLPAFDAMRSTELATRLLDLCQQLHAKPTRQELLAATFDRLVALTSQDVSKEDWIAEHSVAKHVLEWIVRQVAFPSFGGDVLGRVLALVFPLVDDLTDATQLVGARMLLHIVRNVTDTELRWYKDVLLEVLRGATTTRKPATLDCLVESLVLSLDKLSPPNDFQLYDRFVPRLLNDWSLSSDVLLRGLYTRHVRAIVSRLGAPHSIYLIRFLQPLLKVLVASFESVNGSLTIDTLETLRLVVTGAWPRVPAHAEEILVGVLKAVALCEVFHGSEAHLPTAAEKAEILRLSHEVVTLLTDLDKPRVVPMLQRVAVESPPLKPFVTQWLE